MDFIRCNKSPWRLLGSGKRYTDCYPPFYLHGHNVAKVKNSRRSAGYDGQLIWSCTWWSWNFSSFCWCFTCSYHWYCRGDSCSHGLNFITSNVKKQLFTITCYWNNCCFRHFRANNSTLDSIDNFSRSTWLCS